MCWKNEASDNYEHETPFQIAVSYSPALSSVRLGLGSDKIRDQRESPVDIRWSAIFSIRVDPAFDHNDYVKIQSNWP